MLACLASAGTASAADFQVDRTQDTLVNGCTLGNTDDCTLRGALDAANTNPGTDSISFEASLGTLTIATPLTPPSQPVVVNAGTSGARIVGGGGYSCAGSLYAIDLTNPAATGSQLRNLPISNVCNRAVKSDAVLPTVRIGPRRGDGSLPITGTGDGTVADIFTTSSSGGVGDQEATQLKQTGVAVVNGGFAFNPTPELGASDLVTAYVSGGPATTSNFAVRAGVPADISSPTLIRAVAVSNSRVRADFSESISQASLGPADFSISMGVSGRSPTATTSFANSVFIDVSNAWKTGEAGSLSLSGSGVVTDLIGNEIVGAPGTPVYAGPGDIEPPRVTSIRISPSKICKSVRRGCRRTATRMRIGVSERARITTTVTRVSTRRSKEILSFRDRLDPGVTFIKIKNSMVGRRLPRGRMIVTVVAEDVSRTFSDPAETYFNVR